MFNTFTTEIITQTTQNKNHLKVAKKKAAKKISTRRTKTNLHDTIIESIQDKKGDHIVSLDLRNITDAVADFFILCDAESTTQVRAIAEHISQTTGKKLKELPYHSEGLKTLEWVLLDYVDVLVHIFQKDAREFYQLEDLWHDAKKSRFE